MGVAPAAQALLRYGPVDRQADPAQPTTVAKVYGPAAGVALALAAVAEVLKRHEDQKQRDAVRKAKARAETKAAPPEDVESKDEAVAAASGDGEDANVAVALAAKASAGEDAAVAFFGVEEDSEDCEGGISFAGDGPGDADATGAGWDTALDTAEPLEAGPPGLAAAPGWS